MAKQKQRKNAQQKLNEGSIWLTVASILSRILGVIYIIPWRRWMGSPELANEANALFNIGYRWYSIFLAVTIAGVPSAIAARMSYYMAKGEYKTSRRLFKQVVYFMLTTGIVGALLLYFLAPLLAANTPSKSLANAVLTIRSLAPALAILPLLSITRGFFQAYQDMKPSALSQFFEQLVRVVYMLSAVYIIRLILEGEMVHAVAQSTFAAFIGALAAFLTLGIYYVKDRDSYALPEEAKDEVEEKISTLSLMKEIIGTAIPFVITGSFVEVANLIDTNTFLPIMKMVTNFSEARIINDYAVFGANVNKVITVIVSISLAIASTLVPVISDTYTREKEENKTQRIRRLTWQKTEDVVKHAMALFSIIMLPSSFGLLILAQPVYQLIYNPDPSGTFYLQISCLMAIVEGLYFLCASTLQAMGFHKEAITGVVAGFLSKLAFQFTMMFFFKTAGALYASILAFSFVIIYYLFVIEDKIGLAPLALIKRNLKIFIASLAMFILAGITKLLLDLVFGETLTLMEALIESLVVSGVGVIVFSLLTLKTEQLDIVIGNGRARRLRQVLHL